ncbi:unannotated protein [freshwater metagenome]|uniref:Unannotated protein n=1 Tax=freshwater metagenome TaxID=449393 RepID=A0A6J6E8G7_9ZZZZ
MVDHHVGGNLLDLLDDLLVGSLKHRLHGGAVVEQCTGDGNTLVSNQCFEGTGQRECGVGLVRFAGRIRGVRKEDLVACGSGFTG